MKKTVSFKTEQSYGMQFQRILKSESFLIDNCYRIADFNVNKYYKMKKYWIKSKKEISKNRNPINQLKI